MAIINSLSGPLYKIIKRKSSVANTHSLGSLVDAGVLDVRIIKYMSGCWISKYIYGVNYVNNTIFIYKL